MCAPSPFLVCSPTPFCAPPSSFQWGKFSVTPRKPEGWRVKAGMERGPSGIGRGDGQKQNNAWEPEQGSPILPRKPGKLGLASPLFGEFSGSLGEGRGSLLFWEGERTAAAAGLGAVTFRPRLRLRLLRAGSAERGQSARSREAWRDWSCSTLWPPGSSSCCTRWLESGE